MKKTALVLALSALCVSGSAFAQEGESERQERPRHHRQMPPEVKEAFKACFKETGVAKPEKGVRPSKEDRAKIDECLKSKGIEKPKHDPRKHKQVKDQ